MEGVVNFMKHLRGAQAVTFGNLWTIFNSFDFKKTLYNINMSIKRAPSNVLTNLNEICFF
jgi:hypothetical protein